jgi:hypothetical protein
MSKTYRQNTVEEKEFCKAALDTVTKRPTMFKNIIYDVKLVKLYNSMLDKCHYTIGNLPKEKSFLVEKKRDNCEGSFILVCMHCSAKSVYFTTSKSR